MTIRILAQLCNKKKRKYHEIYGISSSKTQKDSSHAKARKRLLRILVSGTEAAEPLRRNQRFQIMVNNTTRNTRQDRRTSMDIRFCADIGLQEKKWNFTIGFFEILVFEIFVFEILVRVLIKTPPAIFKIVEGAGRIYHRTDKSALSAGKTGTTADMSMEQHENT